jgi:hypothetical protein
MATTPLDPIEARIRNDVAEFGWSVLKIFPTQTSTLQWAYSIGVYLTRRRPEICIFGLDLVDAHATINRIADAVGGPDEVRADAGYTHLLEDERTCRLRLVDARWYDAFFGRAVDFYAGRDFPMLQLFWADAAGNYPWDDHCDSTVSSRQPRLDAAGDR